MKIYSPSFKEGEVIPKKYTCDGEDISPPLFFSDIPEGSKYLVLIVEDPDAPGGTFIHWLLYDIPIKITSLPEGIPKEARVKDIGFQGINDFEEIGYNGPCPPVTHKPHRYYFNLYAIKEQTGLKEGAKVRELMRKIQGKTMEKASYMGIYGRRR